MEAKLSVRANYADHRLRFVFRTIRICFQAIDERRMAEYVISLSISLIESQPIVVQGGHEVLNLKADKMVKEPDIRSRRHPKPQSRKMYRSYAEPAQPTEQTELCAE